MACSATVAAHSHSRLVVDRFGYDSQMELTDSQHEELTMLTNGRWDPRKGKSKQTGVALYRIGMGLFVILVISSCVFVSYPLSEFIFLGLALLVLIPMIWFKWKSRQTRDLARAHDYFLCPWCRYLLEDLDESGVCPECGTAYEKGLCQELYRSAFAPVQLESKARLEKERKAWRLAILVRDGMFDPDEPQLDPN
ncbi:MAG: hypothetical protein CMJ25_19700 [Phycisphaerae bacterium]|nr:hypothetical protein [Phycisphaerae bacterium]